MKKVVIITLIVAVVIAGAAGLYVSTRKDKVEPVATTENTQTESTTSESSATNQAVEEVIITYSDTGYSPATVTVKTGSKVTVKNNSSRVMQFDSDPHPAHTNNTELNADAIAPGKAETFTVIRTGTFGYHNHLNEDQTGTIIVQ